MEIGVAVIGVGPAGQSHAFGLRNAMMSDRLKDVDVKLRYVVDADLARAVDVARRYGFEQGLVDVETVIADPDVQAVCIAVPNFLADDMIERLIAAGKAVLAEKPLGTSNAQAQALAQAADASGVVTGVGYSYRRIPALAEAHNIVTSGAIGTPLFAMGRFFADYAADPSVPMIWRFEKSKSGGGALYDMGTHVIDALEYLLGPVSEVVSAQLDITVTERATLDGAGTASVDTDDTTMSILRHESGALSTLAISRVAVGKPCEMGVSIHGTEGYVSFDFSRLGELELFRNGSGEPGKDGPMRVIAGPAFPNFSEVMPMGARGSTAGYGEAFICQALEFLCCVRDGRPMDTGFRHAAATMAVAESIEKSAVTSGPVRIER